MTIDTEALSVLMGQPMWLGGCALAFGLVVGSFLNVVIHRLPLGESIVFPPSHCPGCDAHIAPYDNVPVLSYLVLRGACRSCGHGISVRYPAVELLTGMVFALVALRFGFTPATLLFTVFAAGLIVAGVVDLDHQIIPDEISLGGLAVGLLVVPAWLLHGGASLGDALGYSFGGALLGGGMLWSVGFFHARLSVALGREFEHWPGEGEEVPKPASLDYWMWFPGMGFGDVKLLAMIGAFLGPSGVVATVIGASLLGLVMGLLWAAATRSWNSPFGFGPAIAAAALVALLVPDPFGMLL
ncbi:MAG: prepilin peptidase [Deltaproteobacteria bacterium]|nr:prepilin peptidase [Deltaproteobacteria bacterium]MBW2419708.1 prepilin peptidase [Deltaproteobacteria bacterium]